MAIQAFATMRNASVTAKMITIATSGRTPGFNERTKARISDGSSNVPVLPAMSDMCPEKKNAHRDKIEQFGIYIPFAAEGLKYLTRPFCIAKKEVQILKQNALDLVFDNSIP